MTILRSVYLLCRVILLVGPVPPLVSRPDGLFGRHRLVGLIEPVIEFHWASNCPACCHIQGILTELKVKVGENLSSAGRLGTPRQTRPILKNCNGVFRGFEQILKHLVECIDFKKKWNESPVETCFCNVEEDGE